MDFTGQFTLADLQQQIRQVRAMGPMSQVIRRVPGMEAIADAIPPDADREMARVDGVISSMTPWEREHPDQIDGARQTRIANGCGVAPHDVEKLIASLVQMARLFQQTRETPTQPEAVSTPRWAKWATGLWWFREE